MKKYCFLLVLLTLPFVVRAAVSMDTVTSVTVSTTGFMSANIALDTHNNVHIVYVDTTTQILKYAKLPNGTTSWVVSDVTNKKVAPQSDLAISPSGILHAAYYQTDSPAGFKHAWLSGATWVGDSVGNSFSTSTFVSIAVGSDNVPRIVYNQSVSSSTWYGELSGGVWVTTKAFAYTGGPCALALESNNTPHFLSVFEFSEFRLVSLVTRSSTGTFNFDVFAGFSSPGLVGETNKVGLALDSAGRAHFSLFDQDNGGLIYGSQVDETISLTSVDAAVGAGAFSDIALNSQGKPMIVYFSTGVGFRSAVLGSSWTLSTLESGTFNGVGPSLLFNRYNHYLAAYLNGDSNQLKFITDAPRELSISGTVLDFGGSPIPGAGATLSGGISSTVLTVSAITGAYSADHLFEGPYTVTPSKSGYAFQPTSLSFNPLILTMAAQNFTGGLVNFSTVGNLFNPLAGDPVSFNYSIVPGHVSLKVYSLGGTPVRTLVDQDQSAGDHSVLWDGRDADGHVVASGIYLVYFEADQTKSTTKVAVVK